MRLFILLLTAAAADAAACNATTVFVASLNDALGSSVCTLRWRIVNDKLAIEQGKADKVNLAPLYKVCVYHSMKL